MLPCLITFCYPSCVTTRIDLFMKRIAVIGAGLSGIVVAQRLGGVADVSLFEKSRGVGGRMATRYAGEYEFDHGTQFFTARTPAFREFLRPLEEHNVIADWPAKFAELDRDRLAGLRSWGEGYPHFVGVPRMNDVGKYLSRKLKIVLGTEIVEVKRDSNGWTLVDRARDVFDGFDWLVLTPPARQTANLAADFPELVALCEGHDMLGCFALMLGFRQPVELPWQAAIVRNADISWVSVNSSKPGRKAPCTLLVHSTNAWADAHMDAEPDRVREHMLSETSTVCGLDAREAEHCQVHRWRYANIRRQGGPRCYVDDDSQLAACGDWFVRGKVEAAFTSADELAAQLLPLL